MTQSGNHYFPLRIHPGRRDRGYEIVVIDNTVGEPGLLALSHKLRGHPHAGLRRCRDNFGVRSGDVLSN